MLDFVAPPCEARREHEPDGASSNDDDVELFHGDNCRTQDVKPKERIELEGRKTETEKERIFISQQTPVQGFRFGISARQMRAASVPSTE